LELGWHVVTDEKYRRAVLKREELSRYFERIEFASNPEDALDDFDAVVFAKTPEIQEDFLKNIRNYKGHLFLEKPLSSTPDIHLSTLNLLIERDLDFSVAYLFPYLDWSKNIVGGKSNFAIQWNIPSPPTLSWKEDSQRGGGIASYYAVHFLPLLMELEVSLKECDFAISDSGLVISFESPSRSGIIEISLASPEDPHFSFSTSGYGQTATTSFRSPFGPMPVKGIPDPRIPALIVYLLDCSTKENLQRSRALEFSAIEFRKILGETDGASENHDDHFSL
jgi:hypothetical protein